MGAQAFGGWENNASGSKHEAESGACVPKQGDSIKEAEEDHMRNSHNQYT